MIIVINITKTATAITFFGMISVKVLLGNIFGLNLVVDSIKSALTGVARAAMKSPLYCIGVTFLVFCSARSIMRGVGLRARD